jgi:hypothetical protein
LVGTGTWSFQASTALPIGALLGTLNRLPDIFHSTSPTPSKREVSIPIN